VWSEFELNVCVCVCVCVCLCVYFSLPQFFPFVALPDDGRNYRPKHVIVSVMNKLM
jgi:hypothetical protein